MTAIYRNPSTLVATRLGPSAPLGLFRVSTERRPASLFYVVEIDDKRHGIVLVTNEARFAFTACKLTEDFANWEGLALGEVEAEVDINSAMPHSYPRPPIGHLWIGREKLCIGARPDNGVGTMSVPIGTNGSTGDANGAAFRRWRLIQRDHAGESVVLFEADRTAESPS